MHAHTQEKARAAGQAAERLKSFAGGLRSAILRDDDAVEDQWAPASRSKHLRSLRAASVPLQPGSPTSFSATEGEADMGPWDGSQPLAGPKAWTASKNNEAADTAALDAEMEAFVDDLLADEADIAASRTTPAQTTAQTTDAILSIPASKSPALQEPMKTASQVVAVACVKHMFNPISADSSISTCIT